jgi:hypothetical protein
MSEDSQKRWQRLKIFFLAGNKPLAQLFLALIGFCFPISLFFFQELFDTQVSKDVKYLSIAIAGFFVGAGGLLELIRNKEQEGLKKYYSIVTGLLGLIFFWSLSLILILIVVIGEGI